MFTFTQCTKYLNFIMVLGIHASVCKLIFSFVAFDEHTNITHDSLRPNVTCPLTSFLECVGPYLQYESHAIYSVTNCSTS